MKINQIPFFAFIFLCDFLTLLLSSSLNPEEILLISASPLNTLQLKQYQSGIGYHLALTQDGNHSFISCMQGGFIVFDISDPFNPKFLSKFDGYDVRQVALDNSYAYVVDGILGLTIYDISNIVKIVPVSNTQFSESVTSVKKLIKSESLLLVGNGVLFCVDVSNKLKPSLLSQAGTNKSISYDIVVNKEETFVYVSQGQLGVGIYNIKNQKGIVQILLQAPYWIVFQTALHPDEDTLYVVDGWYGLFSTDITSAISPNPPNPIQLVFNTIAQFPGFVIVGAILNTSSQYLIISLKSIGFKIYDISSDSTKKMNPVITYQLEGSYFMRSFAFSANDTYFYVSNGLELVLYEKVVPNLNNNFPNIFNSFQSTLTFLGNEFWPYHIHMFKDGKTVAVNVGLIGTKLYDISDIDHPVYLSTINSISGTSQDYVYAQPSNENILFVGGSQLGIHIFNITDKSNPVIITTYAPQPNMQNNSDGLDMNDDRSIVIIGNSDQGIGVADFRDYHNPKNYTNWPSLYSSNVKKVKISADSKFAYLGSLEIGLIVLDISNPQNPFMISVVNQMIGENLKMSLDTNYIYLSNGFSGFTIINIQNPYKPFIVSSIPVDGWMMDLFPMFNEQYIVSCTAEKGQITVINMKDKKNPYVFAKYSNIDEHDFAIAATPNYSAAVTIGQKGMRILPLQTNIYIHSQFKEVVTNTNGQSYSRNMDVGESLKVGSTVYITFTSVLTDREIIYQDAFYYQNFEIKSLPSYMQFISNQKQLILQVSKDGVTNNTNGENIILLQLLVQITYQEVMSINSAITLDLALGIIYCLQQNNYLDQSQFLGTAFNQYSTFYLDFYTMLNIPKQPFAPIDQMIQNSLQSLLKYSKIQYPIRFTVASSLVLNKSSNLEQVIQTPSSNVSVLFTINTPVNQSSANGAFIKKSFQGVLAVFSDSLDQFKLEGSLSNVNLALNQNIQIANLTALENIIISYTISDGSNFDIKSQDTLPNLAFLALNKPVVLKKAIQQQLDSQFSRSGLYVTEQFNFKLDSQTFVDLDTYDTDLIYTAYFIHSGGTQEQINETSNKIQFNSRDVVFLGLVPQSDLFSSYRIRVFASDGYTYASDEFVISFNLMPLSLIVQLIIQIVGPIIGALGIWKYRSFLHRLLMRKTYTYLNEDAFIGREYRKKIVLMNAIQGDIENMWQIYKKENKDYKQQVWQKYELNREEFLEDIVYALEKIYSADPKKYPFIHENEFIFQYSRLYHILHLYIIKIYLSQSSKQCTMKAFNFLKKKGIKEFKCKNNWYRYYVKLNNDAGWQAFKRKKEGESGYNQTLVYEASQQELANQTFIQQIQVTDYCPFPVIEFYEDKIASVIEEQKLDCDINYIKELIKLECYGIILSQPFRIVPARGESLHLLSSDLISINAYIKDKGSCMCLKKCLEIDYKPIGLYHNSPLPSWLNCDIIDDVIYLWGTPTNKDRGRIQLRLNDLFGLTVMQFDLIISHKDDQENPIKKLTSERNIKLQMRMNNNPKAPPSIDQNSVKTKNNQNSIEDYMNIHSDNKLNVLNSRQKGMSIYAQKSYMSKQTSSDNDLDRVEDQEIGSIEMIQPQEDIRQFKYVPSQQKQKRVLQQQQSHLKNNEQTQQNLNDEEGGLQLRLQENQSKIQNTSEQQK